MATPGQLLGIDLQAGHNHFNEGIGYPSGHVDKSPQDIAGGFQSNPEFISVDADAWVRFRVRMDGGTTSSGTKYPRSELREYDDDNTTKIAFDGNTGTHYMQATSRIVHVAPNKPWVCFFQVHDASSDLCRVQLEGTSTSALKVVARNTPPGGGSETVQTIMASYTLGTPLDWRMEIIDGQGKVYLNGAVVSTFPAGASGLYFKCGAYAQSNETIDAADEYVAVDIKAGTLKHFHTGWATPTDYLAGSGGGGGNPPPQTQTFKMGFGSCINPYPSDSNALAQCATMSPDYFYQAGDIWYDDGGSDFVAHYNTQISQPGYSSLLNALAAKGPLSERHIVNWSDHDAFANNATGSSFGPPNTAYRQLFPSVPVPSNGIYRAIEIGRVLFLLTDERTFKSPNSDTDNSSKTVLGATQKQWFKNQIAQSTHALIVVLGDIPITTPTQTGDDAWAGYNTERNELAAALNASSSTIIRLSGNMHALAATSNTYGYDRAWQAAGLNQVTKVSSGGDGLGKSYPLNGSSGEGVRKQMFGMVTFTDDGSQITVSFEGYEATSASAKTLRLSDSITVTAPGGLPGGGGGTGGGGDGVPGPTVHVGGLSTDPAGGPITPGLPTEAILGDYLMTEVHSRYGHTVSCSDPDWQLLATRRGSESPDFAGAIYVFGHELGEADTAPTYSSDGSDGGLMGITSSWGDFRPESSVKADNANIPVVAPSGQITQRDSLAVYFVTLDNDWSLTAPSNGSGVYAQTANGGPDGTDGAAIACAYRQITTVGASGSCSWTATGTGNPDRWTAATIIMRPTSAPGGGGGLPPPPPAHVLYGIDVSEQHAGLDLAQAKTEGVAFVLAQVGQGAGLEVRPDKSRLQFPADTDTAWAGFLAAAKAEGLPIGGVWLIGNSEAPEAQAARCYAALGDQTIPIILRWQEGSGDYAQLDACVRAFRTAGLSVRMLFYNSDYWRAQRLPNFSNLALAGAVSERIATHNAGTLKQLLAPVTLNPGDYWVSYGYLTTKLLKYARTAIVAGVPRVGADAYPTEDAAALAALLAPATGPDVVFEPPSYPGPDPGGVPVPSDEAPHLIDVQYTFHFADLRTGAPFGELPMTQVKCSTVLGGEAGALTALIPVADPAVRALNPWAVAVPRRTALFVRRIEVYPPGTIANREKVIWGGIVWDLDPLAGTGHLSLKAATFESYLAKRYITEDRTYSQAEQTGIHANLLGYFQVSREGGDIGIATYPITTGRTRDRNYLAKDNHQLLEALQQLARVDDGFDWYIESFRDPISGYFRKRVVYGYPRVGRLADGPTGPLRLRHYSDGSPTNLVAPPQVRRQGTIVNNEMIGIGKSTGDEQLRVVVTGAELGRPEIDTGFPLLQGVHSDTSVSVPETLRENTGAALRQGWSSEILLTEATLQGTTPPTLHDINLGDDVQVDTDDLTWPAPVSLTGRIWAVSVDLAEGDKSEQVTLTLAGGGLSI